MSSLASLRVLLVDDNQHMRAIASTILTSVGVRNVREAKDGAEALEVLRDFSIDVAIVDFKMSPLTESSSPVLSGTAVRARTPSCR
jgi:CheY-like chemotaxis protein